MFKIQVKKHSKKWNTEQTNIIRKSIEAKDYLLVNGYPGTGKTTTIAAMASIFSELGKKVLISTHTNCALDHILTKLQKSEMPFLRFGHYTEPSNNGDKKDE